MSKNRVLKGNEIYLNKDQLEKYVEQLSIEQIIDNKSKKHTFPVNQLKNEFQYITMVYELLNENIKQGIIIHPAGEWLLDNYYIIEENVKYICNELKLKKYLNLPGLINGKYKGFARIYVLANEIAKYTNNQIDKEIIEKTLNIYQQSKNITMDELWSFGIFLKICIIQNIKDICEKIYISQTQKMTAKAILETTIEEQTKKINNLEIINKKSNKTKKENSNPVNIIFDKPQQKYSFVEYMSYSLKKYGKQGYPYLKALEEIVEKKGIRIEQIIKKEHFIIAVSKVSIGNAITSLKNISRINFQEIFDSINLVEEILNKDPINVYKNMSYETKIYYRNVVAKLSKKTGLSEIFIVKKVLEIANKKYSKYKEECETKGKKLKNKENLKETHVGYYLIDEGKKELLKELNIKYSEKTDAQKKVIYVVTFFTVTVTTAVILGIIFSQFINPIFAYLISISLYIPISEIYLQILNYLLIKITKAKVIPKMNMLTGIGEENRTFVVIPTIVNNKEKVKKLLKKLEVFYLANKSENMYFAVLGDCTTENEEHKKEDDEIIKTAREEVKKLNEKYKSAEENNIFHFIYRKRNWSSSERKYLGWERKRGILHQFNKYLMLNKENAKKYIESDFLLNTLGSEEKILDIKYIITLDGDTILPLNTGLELVGAMAHILNKPIIRNGIVEKGYGIIQPRIGIGLESVNKSKFTEIYSEQGGIDTYSNAVSDVYEDNFKEAIFTGKGIYDLEVFHNLLYKVIPENKVLSHDLLESTYLKCGLASDILLMDGYPNKYISYMSRNHRWIRGDWQIASWLSSKVMNTEKNKINNPINRLSKFKIFDNLRRSIFPISALILLFINYKITFVIGVISVLMPLILDLFNYIVYRKEITEHQINFSQTMSGIKKSILKGLLEIITLPDKVYVSINAILKTLYRLRKKIHLLEWTTSEEAEILNKNDLKSYYKKMWFSVLIGFLIICYFTYVKIVLGLLWIFSPYIMWYISKPKVKKTYKDEVNSEEEHYIKNIAKNTWEYFETYMIKENNYLPPDNYQESAEKEFGRVAYRTSSTNIGLAMLAVISAYDMKFIDKSKAMELLENMLETIIKLEKWQGHLYNWYDIKTLEPLRPRYISSVDSGNFVGYLFVVKEFLIEQNVRKELVNSINDIIKNTNFVALYNSKIRLFSIGFNIEEQKLTDSYYDFLASEARQTSFVAIALRQISSKHWNNLSRTLTVLNGYKGLISWSGTAFEYLMPNIIIKKYEDSLIDESCKFLVMSSKLYANKLNIPWGISESAFNLKDLYGNYQYKAFGIPWLGVKRGLADDVVVSPYSCVLAIDENPKDVVANLKKIEKVGGTGRFGLYEAIDFTPERLEFNEKYKIVKTYMAHHQALILLSINNLINNNILQNRFYNNPEIEAVDILLQEKMPRNIVITKKKKEKIEKLKYKDYEDFAERVIIELNPVYENTNIISNDNYTIFLNDRGQGFSKYKEIYINRYKKTAEENQAIKFYIKNKISKNIFGTVLKEVDNLPKDYAVVFNEAESNFEKTEDNIKSKLKITISPEDNVEIRELSLKNVLEEKVALEVNALIEPVLSTALQDYAHPSFNNMSLEFQKYAENIIVKRRMKSTEEENLYLAVTLYCENEEFRNLEFEIDKKKIMGRNNNSIPEILLNDDKLSNKIELTVNPMLLLRKNIEIESGEELEVCYIMAIAESKEAVLKLIEKYKNKEKIKETFQLQKARVEAENRYLMLKAKNILNYQEMLRELLYKSYFKKNEIYNLPNNFENKNYSKEKLWKFGISGDIPYILLKIKNELDIEVLQEVLKAYEYFKLKNIKVDLIILNEESYSYDAKLKQQIDYEIQNNQIAYMINNGIYVISDVEKSDIEVLEFRANLIIDAVKGNLATILKEQKQEYLEHQKYWNRNSKVAGNNQNDELLLEKFIKNSDDNNKISKSTSLENLKFVNEYGGFSADGKEYHIVISKKKKLPTVWSNLMANDNFGTLVTEINGGYTWFKNARLNRITAWNNNPVLDMPSEIIYVKDIENSDIWTLGYSVKPQDIEYNIIYGYGYSFYKQVYGELLQENQVFVPVNDSIKINYINIRNLSNKKRIIKLYYYIKPVLGEDEIETNSSVFSNLDYENNFVIIKNLASNFGNNSYFTFISSSEKILSYTSSKKNFIGSGSIENPEMLLLDCLDNQNGIYEESIGVIEIEVTLNEYENKEVSLNFGVADTLETVVEIKNKYSNIEKVKEELDNVKKYWNEKVNRLQVKTPDEATNIMLNGWNVYQTIVSRMYAKTGYYQSGGAIGYRDQLQDAIGMKYIDKELLKKQILVNAAHQFEEGDVLHWWHEEINRGIRTKFSDDLLWLPYAVIEYIELTGDYKILEEKVPYLSGEKLKDLEDERYDLYLPRKKESIENSSDNSEKINNVVNISDIQETILDHIIRAIRHSMQIGKNGFLKIGSGDWNDGFSTVGNKGKGESIWLTFFFYNIIDRFSKIISGKEFENIDLSEFRKNLNNIAWDGKWFKRAITDDGKILGTSKNEECKIDSIAQSWSIISNSVEKEKQIKAFESVEKYLIDKENKILKLLTPAFDKSNLNPGYIRKYLNGVRENGGQYSHGSLWLVLAATILKYNDKAFEYYSMFNPINHSISKKEADRYEVEPYVIAADIYGEQNLIGRGGWTWYTGASAWFYKIGIENILGLKIKDERLSIHPCIPAEWKEYKIRYIYGNSVYNIKVVRSIENTSEEKFLLNGIEIPERETKLIDNGKINDIEYFIS